jgi:hypothetical protein
LSQTSTRLFPLDSRYFGINPGYLPRIVGGAGCIEGSLTRTQGGPTQTTLTARQTTTNARQTNSCRRRKTGAYSSISPIGNDFKPKMPVFSRFGRFTHTFPADGPSGTTKTKTKIENK